MKLTFTNTGSSKKQRGLNEKCIREYAHSRFNTRTVNLGDLQQIYGKNNGMNPTQFRMARAVLGESIETVARKAKVNAANLRRLELGRPVSDQIRDRVQAMYEDLGMIFQEDELGEFSVLVKPFTLSLIEEDTFDSNKQPGCGKEIKCIVTPATGITPNKEPSA